MAKKQTFQQRKPEAPKTIDEFVALGAETTEAPKPEIQRTTIFLPVETHYGLRSLALRQRSSMTELILAAVKEKYGV